jgi:hypothetical protein
MHLAHSTPTPGKNQFEIRLSVPGPLLAQKPDIFTKCAGLRRLPPAIDCRFISGLT